MAPLVTGYSEWSEVASRFFDGEEVKSRLADLEYVRPRAVSRCA